MSVFVYVYQPKSYCILFKIIMDYAAVSKKVKNVETNHGEKRKLKSSQKVKAEEDGMENIEMPINEKRTTKKANDLAKERKTTKESIAKNKKMDKVLFLSFNVTLLNCVKLMLM